MVVSEIMIVYKLSGPVNGQKILEDIQKLVNSYQPSVPGEVPLLTISIKPITHDDTSMIPKLEYKEE